MRMKKPKIIGLNTTFASLNYPNWIFRVCITP